MAIPLLEYAPSSQNARVAAYEVPGDEQPRIFSTDNLLSPTDMGNLIEAAYRQIFFHAFKSDRERFLESQLRNGQITVREFIRGLCLSNTFTKSFYNLNSNYRFVEHCVQKILGRDVYSEREKIAWSIVIATKGRAGFINDLINSQEYLDNFGDNIVPFQRRRVLPSGASELPFNIKSPRYEAYHRGKLGFPQIIWQTSVRRYTPPDKQAKAGDPSLFMGMARSISAQGNPPQRVSPYNIDYESKVPYRKR
ncbi:phycobilisome rod-core linker polypeptide [Microseira wollei]|uniref:Phycobilisome linker polypeptide n=1 Tax=Microseira wollei NIES-4236 TaxID=2530354 RepID=A0AAV3XR49_9CYAN|nr:phycobilisome rod-core linker polypeptide [Microseira wollei]GET42790.1 phycobilisome linker polypeptide [Microseira wollei NIES-4236]